MNSENIARILRDDDFKALADRMRDQLTRKVMAHGTVQEERDEALHQYWALDTLISKMRTEAQKAEEKLNE